MLVVALNKVMRIQELTARDEPDTSGGGPMAQSHMGRDCRKTDVVIDGLSHFLLVLQGC